VNHFYQEMQNSDEVWIGEVPSRWKSYRIKDITRLSPNFSNGTPDKGELCSVIPMEKVSEKGEIISDNVEEYCVTTGGLTNFEAGDVIFAKITPCMENGKGAYVEKLPVRYAFGSTEFHVLRPRNMIVGKFLYYYTYNSVYRDYAEANMTGSAGQKRVSSRFINYTRIFLPGTKIQHRIVAYLDKTCAAIDKAIEAKQTQLETLDALRKLIIHKAVTRGLDDSLELKDSGVEWLGRIPKHWRVRRIKYLCDILRGKFTHRPRNDPRLYDGPYAFIQTGDITSVDKYVEAYKQTLNEEGFKVSKQFPKGTLVMTIAANVGDVAILNFEACFPDSIVGFYPHHNVDIHYLYYLFIGMRQALFSTSVLNIQHNLNVVRIGTLATVMPPNKEQCDIAHYLDQKCSELTALQFNIEKQISTLEQYRKSLIHECVTGKRRITEDDVQGQL
jgi:type I restriction enzyme S subunit